jgi:hypothetical protein
LNCDLFPTIKEDYQLGSLSGRSRTIGCSADCASDRASDQGTQETVATIRYCCSGNSTNRRSGTASAAAGTIMDHDRLCGNDLSV